jgi:arylsulfatase A-like enzyme
MAKRPVRGKILWPVLLLTVVLAGAFMCISLLLHRPVKPNVLWITIDSLRYDHLGCYGYERAHTPSIDAIAGQGVAFSKAIAQASCTRYSVPSMVSGTYPLSFSARIFDQEPDEAQRPVAQVLQEMGYRTWAIEVPITTATRGFEKKENTGASTAMRTRSCLQALQKLREENFFVWLYYWDPHAPYQPPGHTLELFESQPFQQMSDPKREVPVQPSQKASRESLRKAFQERRKKGLGEGELEQLFRDKNGRLRGALAVLGRINFYGDLVPTEEDRQHLINLYDAEISFVDGEIEKVVTELQRLDLWDKTLVLITADHGEAFGEHDKYYHGLNLYDEVVRVPLIIKPPRSSLRGRLIDSQVRNVDIMPTIMDYCGAPIPGDIHGISLRPFMEGKRLQDQPAYMETYFRERGSIEHLFLGYRTAGHKLVYDLCAGSAELFDLKEDPEEKINLLAVPSGEGSDRSSEPLERRIREAFLDHLGIENLEQLGHRKLAEEMDKATEERLKALGYIE